MYLLKQCAFFFTLSVLMPQDIMENNETAVLGAGCFWCVEAVFQRLDGVQRVVPGYAGGNTHDPTYESVCSGTTGHAEVAKITFDPDTISYVQILDMFWRAHDPTTLNRQGSDTGTQYRSAIFHLNPEQEREAKLSKANAEESNAWKDPIVTEIKGLEIFHPAEDYHHNYYQSNPSQAYCKFVIEPKLRKLFSD